MVNQITRPMLNHANLSSSRIHILRGGWIRGWIDRSAAAVNRSTCVELRLACAEKIIKAIIYGAIDPLSCIATPEREGNEPNAPIYSKSVIYENSIR